MSDARRLTITQIRSEIGCTQRQRQTLRALGLTRRGRTVTVEDNPCTQGRLRVVAHLIEVRD